MVSITIAGTKKTDINNQLVGVILDDGIATYKLMVNSTVIAGQALTDYLESMKEAWMLNTYHNMYFGADLSKSVGKTDVEKFTAWITNGAKNPDKTDSAGNVIVGEVIAKQPWGGNHDALSDRPLNTKDIGLTTRNSYKAAVTDTEKLAVIETILFGKGGA